MRDANPHRKKTEISWVTKRDAACGTGGKRWGISGSATSGPGLSVNHGPSTGERDSKIT